MAKFSLREWTFLILLSVVYFTKACIFSLQAPFYPPEAASKGVTPSVYSFVMAFYRLTSFVLCIFFGVYIGRIGLRKCYLIAIFLSALVPTLFGFLDYFQSYSLFLIFSVLLRGLDGAGSVGAKASTCMIIGIVFPENPAFGIALVDACYLIGQSVGPVLGALLFDAEGFTVMFLCFGLIQFGFLALVFLFLPELPPAEEISQTLREALRGFMEFLQIPGILLFVITTMVAKGSLDFLNTILEPYLTQFHLSTMGTSLVFFMIGPVQLLAPGWGYLIDRMSRAELITLTGSLISLLGFGLVGPAYFIPVNPSVGLTVAGLLLVGLGQGSVLPSCFSKMMRGVEHDGLSEARSYITLLACYYSAAQYLGDIIGDGSAGVLYDNFGFRAATLFPLICFLVVSVLLLIYIYKRRPSQGYVPVGPIEIVPSNDEKSPLLKSDNSRLENEI